VVPVLSDVLTLPVRAGSRLEARTLLEAQPADLGGVVVRIDGTQLGAGSSSFMDELVKVVLEQRGAEGLVLDGVTSRAATFAEAAAQRRGVAGRLSVTRR